MTTVKVYWDREFEEIRIRNEKRDILATIFSVPQNMGSGVVRKYEIVVHGEVYPITFKLCIPPPTTRACHNQLWLRIPFQWQR